jgi:protein-disulfide isomerase
MKKLYIVLAVVAAVGIGAVGISVSSASGNAAIAPVAVEGLDDLERLVELAKGETKGDENAPVTIIEFGDFQCPGCQAWATQVKPQVELAYVESGKAKLVFYDWPIVNGHPNAFFAARASRCAADQDMYWEYHDNLFRNQARWAAMTSPASAFVDYAETLGLDAGEFSSCLHSDQHAELVTANMELGNQLGVNGTPTIYVEQGGSARRVGNDFQSLRTYIDGILAEEASDPSGQ